ncbi:hypothetical protein PENSPDRAFT_595249, partial [Peniophora sp. CONT]
MWDSIQARAPTYFVEYLQEYWMGQDWLEKWTAMHRVGRDILSQSNTNMLIEVFHHVLKGTFLEGQQNRRVDDLIHILLSDCIKHYVLRQIRQEAGFEGRDL